MRALVIAKINLRSDNSRHITFTRSAGSSQIVPLQQILAKEESMAHEEEDWFVFAGSRPRWERFLLMALTGTVDQITKGVNSNWLKQTLK
ncbi:hypothetical protein CEXT_625771 [Caerostris extrusa]|uniref:Uncharacterized protein n=1 Tax=Caerostris extrusa TaxID=172846 RepID=A0AAV4MC27_CAEEX|nr:hypothetical protein CEXT_625771 [Caerostris extrusa]